MSAPQIYVLIAITSLLLIAVSLILIKKNKKPIKLSPLRGLSFAFVIAGICFGENRILGYGLMGIGIILAFIDVYKKLKKKK
jgi:hypothetical protein